MKKLIIVLIAVVMLFLSTSVLADEALEDWVGKKVMVKVISPDQFVGGLLLSVTKRGIILDSYTPAFRKKSFIYHDSITYINLDEE